MMMMMMMTMITAAATNNYKGVQFLYNVVLVDSCS